MMSSNTTSMPDEVDANLLWRCRRGMLELDILLNQFIKQQYCSLDLQQKTTLDQFLDYPDQLLFDLLLGHMESSDSHVSALVQKIRQSVTA